MCKLCGEIEDYDREQGQEQVNVCNSCFNLLQSSSDKEFTSVAWSINQINGWFSEYNSVVDNFSKEFLHNSMTRERKKFHAEEILCCKREYLTAIRRANTKLSLIAGKFSVFLLRNEISEHRKSSRNEVREMFKIKTKVFMAINKQLGFKKRERVFYSKKDIEFMCLIEEGLRLGHERTSDSAYFEVRKLIYNERQIDICDI